ncbi:MAG: DUF262 domain-containing protein [Methylococcaceae bacterium]
MSIKLVIEPRFRRLQSYIQDIEKGLLQVPPFQRDKVWDNQKRKELFDSLKNGYPIGSLLLWRPDSIHFEDSLSRIGPYTVNIENAKDFFYILDGFQRLSTIFGCLINPYKTTLPIDKTEWQKDFYICYDLENEEFFIPRLTSALVVYQIPVYELIDTKLAYLREREFSKYGYSEEQIESYMNKYHILGASLTDYVLPSTEIKGGDVEAAVEIFTRVNSKGSIISPDWMVSALSYNKDEKGFKFSRLIDDLIDDLKIYNFNELSRHIILQCIVNSFGKAHFDQMKKKDHSKLDKLAKRPDFVEKSKKTIESIKTAVKFLFEELLLIDGKLLPYTNQLIFITDFFNQIENPTEKQLDSIKDWFWITTYSGYFTMYSLSKQRDAYHQFQDFLKDENENPVYNDKPNSSFETTEFPNKLYFGSVRAKALILFMLSYANKFKKVDAETIEGLKLNYLFYDIKDDKGNFFPESAIVFLDEMQSIFPKSKDMSFMLENYKDDYQRYFLTQEMQTIFSKKDKDYKRIILEKRKELIIEAEKQFVENLGIVYTI